MTLGLLRAHRPHGGRPLAAIHLEVHCDTWQDSASLLEELAPLPFVAMDGVLVAPPSDLAEPASQAAATCAWTCLAGQRRRLGA